MFNKILFVLVLLGLAACSKTTLSPGEYIQWAQKTESGLRREVKIGSHTYDLQYITPEMQAIRKAAKNASVELDTLLHKERQNKTYAFQLRIKTNGLDEIFDEFKEEHSAKISYAAFPMQHDFKLIENGDTLNPVYYHMERSFGITPFSTFSISFNKKNISKEDLLLIYDDQLLNDGRILFRIKQNQEVGIQ